MSTYDNTDDDDDYFSWFNVFKFHEETLSLHFFFEFGEGTICLHFE